MSDKPQEPVLDLDEQDIAPLGKAIKLGGIVYRTINPNAMGLADFYAMQQLEQQMSGAIERLRLKPDDQAAGAEAEQVMTQIIQRIVPDLPAVELVKLGFVQKTKVYAFFSGKLDAFQAAVDKATSEPKKRKTTPTSSRG